MMFSSLSEIVDHFHANWNSGAYAEEVNQLKKEYVYWEGIIHEGTPLAAVEVAIEAFELEHGSEGLWKAYEKAESINGRWLVRLLYRREANHDPIA